MKNKASLTLLEQLVMILVFSLAAAACLRLFAWSDRTSREMQQQSQAVILCQNGAETIKAAADLEAGARILGAEQKGSLWTVEHGSLSLELEAKTPPVSGMGMAEIRAVLTETEAVLFSLTAGWQEVAP